MKRDSVIQFLKFSIVGLSNTIVSYLVYAALLFIGVNYIVANIVSYFAGVINSFYWNNKYVFDNERSDLSSLISSFSKLLASSAYWIDYQQHPFVLLG